MKTIAKTDTVLALLLVPLTMLFSFTPIFQMLSVFRWHRSEINIMLKLLAAWWAMAVFLPSLALVPFELKYWRYALTAVLALLMVAAIGVGQLPSPNFITDLALIIMLVVLTVGWLTYAGFRYCRGL